MALHVYDDELLTRQLSEGDMTAPDFALLEGEQGSYSDKQLYLAAEHTTLAAAVSDNATALIVQDAGRFRNGETIAVGEEQMLILDGGGTTQFTVQRGYNDTAPVGHNAGARVTSGYLYYLFGILGIEVSGQQTYPALWCRLAFTREGLDSAVPGQFLTIRQGSEPVLIRNDQVMTFWRRISCPPGTPVQFRRDIKWRVWGIELPIAPPFG